VKGILRSSVVLLGALLGAFVFTGTASAASIGLVPDGDCISYASSEGTVFFCDRDLRSAGTGVIDPFLRVNRDGDNADGTDSTFSSGFNTDATHQDGVPATNDFDASQSNALDVDDILFGTPPGEVGQFAIFTVDINQKGSEGSLADILSLNQFELYNCGDNDYTTLSGCTLFFDLFNSGDWVNFDYRNHTGSGAGDIDIYIPAGVGFGSDFIALLDGWGCDPFTACDPSDAETGLFADNDGFQEWIRTGGPLAGSGAGSGGGAGGPGVPEPASLLLFGTGLGIAAATARRRNKKQTK